MIVRPIRALVGAAVALLVVTGSAGPGWAQGARRCSLDPATVVEGAGSTATLLNCSPPGRVLFEVSNVVTRRWACARSLLPTGSRGGRSGAGPSTPGTYTVVVKDQQFNVVASATLTVTARGLRVRVRPQSVPWRSPRPEPASGRTGATGSCRPRRKAGRATTSLSAPPVTTSSSGALGTMCSAVWVATTSSSAGRATTTWTVGRRSTR